MKKLTLTLAAGFIAGGVANADAQSATPLAGPSGQVASSVSVVPKAAFFIGVGGNYDVANFGTQGVYAVGTSNVYESGVLTSSGSAAGPANISMGSESVVGFSAQGGYFQRFSNSDWLWGAKFAYGYLGATATVRNALLPQSGSFTPTGSNTPVPFTGNALVQSYQAKIIQQIALIPFIGHSFERSFVYVGAGPTLSQLRTNLDGLIGFADINGTRTDVSGNPVNFSSSAWVYGGAAVVGATYFFDPSWFLDVSYTFAMTSNQNGSYSSPFSNPNGSNGSTILGTLVGNSSGNVITQGITVTINKAF